MEIAGNLRAYLTGGVVAVGRNWRAIARLCLAPAAAWWLSIQVFGHSQAFFAPIAAILTLTVGVGKRARVLVEIILGAALGVLVGELLILAIGRGAWQLVLVVGLAVTASTFLRMGGLALTQAAISGALLVAIIPIPGGADPALTRFVDAFLGGFVALATIVLIPANPSRDLDAARARVLAEFAGILEKLADAMAGANAAAAAAALERARGTQPLVESVGAAAGSLVETARLSPLRWRQRGQADRKAQALVDLDHALRNTRVLARRVAAMIRHEEPVPPGLVEATRDLARLARTDADNIPALVAIARLAVLTAGAHLTINTATIASQLRAIVADLLLAAGESNDDLGPMLDFE